MTIEQFIKTTINMEDLARPSQQCGNICDAVCVAGNMWVPAAAVQQGSAPFLGSQLEWVQDHCLGPALQWHMLSADRLPATTVYVRNPCKISGLMEGQQLQQWTQHVVL